MGIIQDIHTSGMSLLTDLIQDTANITLKVPLINNSAQFTKYAVKGLVSNIEVVDLPINTTFTGDTLVCELVIEDLKAIPNCPYSDFMAKNIIIEYKNKSYSIVKDKNNSFGTMLILYLNKK